MFRKSADKAADNTAGAAADNTADAAADIAVAAASRADAMLDRLEAYVRHETPTGDRARLDAFADVLVDRHEHLGGSAQRIPGENGDHVLADHPGAGTPSGATPVLLVGHHDTVWPAGAIDGDVPWRVVDDDRGRVVHGPGAFDMKSGLVVIETALALLGELDLPHRPIRVVVAADEEVGSPTATEVVTAAATEAVAALGFESPHPDGALKVGRRGSTRVRIGVAGKEAHAALDPDAGVSAIDELVDQLTTVRAIVDDAPGEVLCNVGTISGGGKTNVVPAEATADIGFRFVDGTTESAVLDAVRSLVPHRDGASVEVRILSRRPAWAPSARSTDLLDRARRAAAAVGQSLDGRPAAGAADTNTTGALGIPTLDGLGPTGAGAHARHEHVVASSLPERAALVTALLAAL